MTIETTPSSHIKNPHSSTLPRFLSQKEVAKIIHKSEAWLERKRWEGGGIPFRKLGRHVLYDEADVLAYIQAHPKRKSTSDEVRKGGGTSCR